MRPDMLDNLLSEIFKEGWICPKCEHGMQYKVLGSSSFYGCPHCGHAEIQTPKRGRIK